jgi:hypothetical protein
MKKYYILFYCILFCFKIYAQEYKRNNFWTLGFAPVLTINFNNISNIETDSLAFPALQFSSTIADTNGFLEFFTTGFILYSKDGSNMKNGDTTNCPLGKNLFNYNFGATIFDQSSIILPKSGNQYYVINTGMSDTAFVDIQTSNGRFDVLSYCIVDMDSNAGKGKVIIKDSIIMQDARLSANKMTATRHANGRDWWLIKPHILNHTYYKFLVTPYGIALHDSQSFNLPIMYSQISQSTFNESGTQYATYSNNYYVDNKLSLFNFDRCSGQLSFFKTVETPHDTSTYYNWDLGTSTCFSPNDSLLYIANKFTIWQKYIYDTSAPILIATPDTNINYFPLYRNLKLAPNDKIYCGNFHGTNKSMVFIDSPNVRGLGCAFRGRGSGAFTQPYTNILTPPNMPNFALGKFLGSGCDTLFATGIQNPSSSIINSKLIVYPNPANSVLYVEGKFVSNAKIKIHNQVGQEILCKQFKIHNSKFKIETVGLPQGLYYIQSQNAFAKFLKE